MKIYNTMSKSLEEFTTLGEGKVKIYQCGPTVYWVQHIGNMRAMLVGDIVRRTLNYLDYDVTYTRNYTDFGHLTGDNIGDADTGEDRMEKGAKKEGLTPEEIADKYIKIFDQDVTSLNTLEPTYSTRATKYIDEMIEIIQDLLDRDFAYLTPEAIYFDISKYADYAKLSGQKLDNLISGAGKGEDTGSAKRNPADFAIWFFRTGSHANTSIYWKSPFVSPEVEDGIGTPGWHIECSAMAIATLGDQMDIHIGGVEHIPIHHTNEIAQSECHTGKQFARYWVHNEHLTIAGKKISKSEGITVLMGDIIEKGYDPMHLRYLFLQAHYRSKQDFTWEALESAKVAYSRLVERLISFGSDEGELVESYITAFKEAISDDFGTPQAIAILWDLLSDNSIQESDRLTTILDFDKVLGLKLKEAIIAANNIEIPSEVEALLKEREIAKGMKDYPSADRIRDEIESLGFTVKDGENGQQVSLKS